MAESISKKEQSERRGRNIFALNFLTAVLTPAKMLGLMGILVAFSASSYHTNLQNRLASHNDRIDAAFALDQIQILQISELTIKAAADEVRDDLIQKQNDQDHTEILRVLRLVESKVFTP